MMSKEIFEEKKYLKRQIFFESSTFDERYKHKPTDS